MTNYSAIKAQPIAIFDSGAGGLPYFELAEKRLPGEYFYYIADTENVPYGEKDTDAILNIVVKIVGRIIAKFDPRCIVIACNTASVVALSVLRETYKLPFVGVVPAVKPAAEGSTKKKFGVLATLQTTKNDYLSGLVQHFAQCCDVILLPAGNLVDLVEHSYFSLSREEKICEIEKVTAKMPLDEIDSIVLACTHFILLEEEFKAVLGNKIRLIDSREGVINQLVRVLDSEKLHADKRRGTNTLFISGETQQAKDNYRLFARKYRLRYGGEL